MSQEKNSDLYFSNDWLSLREAYDLKSRDQNLLNSFVFFLQGEKNLQIVDLASGQGSMWRFLSPLLNRYLTNLSTNPQGHYNICKSIVQTHTFASDRDTENKFKILWPTTEMSMRFRIVSRIIRI